MGINRANYHFFSYLLNAMVSEGATLVLCGYARNQHDTCTLFLLHWRQILIVDTIPIVRNRRKKTTGKETDIVTAAIITGRSTFSFFFFFFFFFIFIFNKHSPGL